MSIILEPHYYSGRGKDLKPAKWQDLPGFNPDDLTHPKDYLASRRIGFRRQCSAGIGHAAAADR